MKFAGKTTSAAEVTSHVYGVAMPTVDAIKGVLNKVGGGPEGEKTIFWTSLREEPVLYVNGT